DLPPQDCVARLWSGMVSHQGQEPAVFGTVDADGFAVKRNRCVRCVEPVAFGRWTRLGRTTTRGRVRFALPGHLLLFLLVFPLGPIAVAVDSGLRLSHDPHAFAGDPWRYLATLGMAVFAVVWWRGTTHWPTMVDAELVADLTARLELRVVGVPEPGARTNESE